MEKTKDAKDTTEKAQEPLSKFQRFLQWIAKGAEKNPPTCGGGCCGR